jgi:hypothetical protein
MAYHFCGFITIVPRNKEPLYIQGEKNSVIRWHQKSSNGIGIRLSLKSPVVQRYTTGPFMLHKYFQAIL